MKVKKIEHEDVGLFSLPADVTVNITALFAHSLVVLSWLYVAASALSHPLSDCSATQMTSPESAAIHSIPSHIYPTSTSNTVLSLSALFVSPFTLKKKPTGSLKIPSHTHLSGQTHNARCRRVLLLLLLLPPRLSTGNLLQTQYDLFDRLKKIRQPLNTLKR